MTFALEPLDSLFFRSGRPFNLGETGQMEIEAVFPPSPTTVVGALRASLARARGWHGQGDWDSALKAVLGDGEDLAQLRFSGPQLLQGGQPLFPAPLYLLGKQTAGRWDLVRLRPSKAALHTDLGAVRLPEPEGKTDGHKLLERCYLTAAGMARALAGGLPESLDIRTAGELWQVEPRIGIRRDRATRTTPEDALYQIHHVRLLPKVALAVAIEGLPAGWQPQALAPLGGESRMAWVTPIADLALPPAPPLAGEPLRYTVTLVTPARFADDSWRQAGGALAGLPGRIVSACLGKPVLIGGFDSRARAPKPLVPYLPAGSSWFMETSAADAAQVLAAHGSKIGEQTAWGFGQILIGSWRDA